MKPVLFFAALGLMLSGCLRYPVTGPTYDRLANLPTEPHERDVKILFPGDPLPEEPYVKLGVVEVHGGGFTSYNELVRALQAQARALGVDVVQLFDRKYMEDTYTAWELTTTDIYSNLAGIGFVSLNNAEYLTNYVATEAIYLYHDSIGWPSEPVCRVTRSYNDQAPTISGDKSFADLIATYSLEHLRYEEAPNWTYYLDQRGRVVSRTYRSEGVRLKKCWFTYNGYGKVTEVRIRRYYPEQVDDKVVIRYDDQKNIAEKLIYQDGHLALREIPAYNERGLRAGSEFYQVAEGAPDQPYLRVVYEFFDPAKLPVGDALVNAKNNVAAEQ